MKKRLCSLALGILLSGWAQAQISITSTTLTYNQDFNTLDTTGTTLTTLPGGWMIAELGTGGNSTYRAGIGSANNGDTYSFGHAGSNDRSLGSLASGTVQSQFGARFENNTGLDLDSVTLIFTMEQWRVGDTSSLPDSSYFYYSTTAPSLGDTSSANWTRVSALDLTSVVTVASASSGTALDGNLAANRSSINVQLGIQVANTGFLYIKWIDKNQAGSDDGLSIDDFSATFTMATTSTNAPPYVMSFSPASGSTQISPAPQQIKAYFSKPIFIGTGSAKVINLTDNISTNLIVNQLSISDTTLTISFPFVLGKKYCVQIDSSLITDALSTKYQGIYDTTTWWFSTAEPVLTVTGLSEDFNQCSNNALATGWTEQNILGSGQNWNCSGTAPNFSMRMNGFSGGPVVNEDWLISPQLNLSAMTNPHITWKTRWTFSGMDLGIYVSTNYTGYGNPNSATWTALPLTYDPVDSGEWVSKQVNVTAYKSTPFFFAYKYTSNLTDGASQWFVDSVFTTEGLNIKTVTPSALPLTVVGLPTAHEIQVLFNGEMNSDTKISLIDLTGRVLLTETIRTQSGKNLITLHTSQLASGLYVIRIDHKGKSGIAKTIVQ